MVAAAAATITVEDAREALWVTRCAIAAGRGVEAFPGVRLRRPGEVRHERRHHLLPVSGGRVVGRVFEADGVVWRAEEVVIVDEEGALGLYAYDTAKHTSATTLLSERCRLFSADVLKRVLAGRGDA